MDKAATQKIKTMEVDTIMLKKHTNNKETMDIDTTHAKNY